MKKQKMLFKKIGTLFLSCIMIVTAVSGCTSKNKLSVKACLSYMKDKYGTEFTLVEGNDAFQWSSSLLEIYVQSSDYPGEKILVVEERMHSDNTIVFRDNYVVVKYKQETKNLAEKMAADVFGECRVLYEVDSTKLQPDKFDNTTTFEEFISDGIYEVYFDVLLPPEHSDQEKEKELKQMEQQCIENRCICTCDVWYSTDEEVYQNINSNVDLMQAGITNEWYTENGQFTIRSDFTVYHEMWR